MSSVEQKIREVMDELQAQVIDGYAGPVNGWSTLKDEATEAILQIIESDVIGEDYAIPPLASPYTKEQSNDLTSWTEGANQLRAEQRANLREDK